MIKILENIQKEHQRLDSSEVNMNGNKWNIWTWLEINKFFIKNKTLKYIWNKLQSNCS